MKTRKFGRQTKLFAILLSGCLLASCEDKTPGIPPAVGEMSHTIGGMVSDMRVGIFKDVTVKLESENGVSLETKTDTLGAFAFTGLKTPGNYKVKVIPGGNYEDVEESVTLENENNAVRCKYVDVQLPVMYKGTVKAGEETQIQLKTTYKSVSNVYLTFPASAVEEETGINIVHLPFVNVPVRMNEDVVEARKVPPFFVLKITPVSGSQELKQEMKLTIGTIIKNKTYLKYLYLYKLENNEWKRVENHPVTFNKSGNRYEVSMPSFGTYMLAPLANVTIMETTKTIPMVMNGVFYNDNDDPLKVNKVRYKRTSGWQFTETTSNAARNAGIKDRNNAGIVLTQMITNVLSRSEKFSTWHEVYWTDYTLPYGTKLMIAGAQEYSTIVYSFTFTEGGTDKVVNVEVNRYGDCKFVETTSN